MRPYYIYILECSDGLLDTGFTNNISRRTKEHNTGLNKNCLTFRRRPLVMLFHQEFNDVKQAFYVEKKIKKWGAKKKRALAKRDYDMLQILSECRNTTHSKYKPSTKEVSTALDRTK